MAALAVTNLRGCTCPPPHVTYGAGDLWGRGTRGMCQNASSPSTPFSLRLALLDTNPKLGGRMSACGSCQLDSPDIIYFTPITYVRYGKSLGWKAAENYHVECCKKSCTLCVVQYLQHSIGFRPIFQIWLFSISNVSCFILAGKSSSHELGLYCSGHHTNVGGEEYNSFQNWLRIYWKFRSLRSKCIFWKL